MIASVAPGDGKNLITNNRNNSWGHAGLAFAIVLIGFAHEINRRCLTAAPTRRAQWRSGTGATSTVNVGAIRSQIWAKMRFQLSQ